MTKIAVMNHTDLPIELIGKVIDHYTNYTDEEETLYFGKTDSIKFKMFEKEYKVTVRYMKKEIQYIIEEANNGPRT